MPPTSCTPTTCTPAVRVEGCSSNPVWPEGGVEASRFWKLIWRQSPTCMRSTIGRGRLSGRSCTLPGESAVAPTPESALWTLSVYPGIGTTSRRSAKIMPCGSTAPMRFQKNGWSNATTSAVIVFVHVAAAWDGVAVDSDSPTATSKAEHGRQVDAAAATKSLRNRIVWFPRGRAGERKMTGFKGSRDSRWRTGRFSPSIEAPSFRSLPGGQRALRGGALSDLALLLDVRKNGVHLLRAHVEIGHPHVLVFREQILRDGVAAGEQLVGGRDVARQPGALALLGHVRQVRTHRVAVPDRVARGAARLEEIFPFADLVERPHRGVAPDRRHALVPVHEVEDRRGEKPRVVHRRVPHPLARRILADHQRRLVPVAVRGIGQRSQPELLADELDVLVLAGEEQPTRPGVELRCVRLEHLGRVVLRIDADRIEEDVLADAVAEDPLHLRELRRLERAAGAAVRVDEVDDDCLVLEQVVVETNNLSVLRGQGNVGKVFRSLESRGDRRR